MRSRMVREGKLGISQNQETLKEEQKMTQALICIITIATLTTLIKVFHYIMRNIFLGKAHYESQNLELRAGENQDDVKLESLEIYMLNHFKIAMIVTREIGSIFLLINASVNVFITLWSCKRVRKEVVKMVRLIKKVMFSFIFNSEEERIEMSTF